MGARDPRVDAYIAKSADFAKPILEAIRDAVHRGCPDVSESIKWGMPFFEYHGILCQMAAFKAHCSLHFWNSSAVTGEQTTRGDRIESVADLPPKKELVALVAKAAKLNEEGVKPKRTPRETKSPLEVPDELMIALAKNKKAKAAFDALPASHKREYAEWISEAKRAETREKRVQQAVEWMAEGKSRNWKYERK
jgi:uncharacterized protein YdeI (YjbR/CyaY-like superfamily)